MKLLVFVYFAYLAATTSGSLLSILSGSNNEISFVLPSLSRAIESKDTRFLEEEISALLESIREILLNGLPEQGIPPLDPLQISEAMIDLDSLGIPEATGFLSFNDLVLNGLSGFEATHIKGSMIVIGGFGAKIEVTLLFDDINLKSDYEADLEIFGINVFGKGDVKLDVKNLQFEVVLAVRLTAPTTERIYLESMTFLPSVEDIHVEFTGLLNDPGQSQEINDLLNSILTNWVNEKAQNISDLIEKIVKYIINNVKPTEPPPPPMNDCEEITSPMQNISCMVVGALEGLQELIEISELEPLSREDWTIDVGEIGIGTGTWTFDILFLAGYSKFILGKVVSKMAMVPSLGFGAEITIPLTWDMIELNVTEHGEIDIMDIIIKSENSKVMAFIRNFDLVIKLFVAPGDKIKLNLGLIPTIAQNDIKGNFTGIFINDVDISEMLTSFVNNDLGKFLEKHGEDVGDIIAGILLKIFDAITSKSSGSDPEILTESNPILNYILGVIYQVGRVVQPYPNL